MRHQGREVALMALYALDGVPSFERPQALRRLWTIFAYQELWDGIFTKAPDNPGPLDEPALWSIADDLTLDPSERAISSFTKPYPDAFRFAEDMVAGVLLQLKSIDPAIDQASRGWRVNRMARIERNILRIGAFEILFNDDVPDPVAINEAIELCKQYADIKAPSFINGVLDRVRKNKQKGGSAPVVFVKR